MTSTETHTTSEKILAIAICAFASFADGYDISALGLAIPLIASDFALPPSALAAAASSSLAGMAIGAVTLSTLADKHGRWQMMTTMLILIASATFGATFSRNPVEMALWRFFAGLGIGAVVPIAIAITSEYASANRKALIVTVVVSFTGVGALSAGLLAPLLAENWGWKGIFGCGAFLPFLAAMMAWLMIKSSKTPDSERATSVASKRPSFTLFSAVKLLFTPQLRRLSILIWSLFWLNLFVNYSLISWLPTLLIGAGWDLGQASRATGLIAIGGIAGGVVISSLTDFGWIKRTYIAAYILAASTFMMFMVAGDNTILWVTLIVIIGLCSFGAQIALSSVAAIFYPAEIRSTAIGWCTGFGRIGSVVGPLVLATLLGANLPSELILTLLSMPMILCVLCIALLPRLEAVRGK
jgi:AAHS family 4-hydroxybenzoate transporter-like MFS transporter